MRSKDEDFVNRVVENVLADPDLNPGNVVDKISDVSGVPKNAILSRNRSKVLVEVRHAGFYVCRQLNMSFPEIGALFDR
ncbi:MAG: helix-turn-helix domain-containing protein, partial [Candidatus Nanoarchaeia archaeon]